MAGKLAEFVAKLGTDREFLEAYGRDRRGTMTRFGLSEEEQRAMVSGDGDAVHQAICEGVPIMHKPVVGGG